MKNTNTEERFFIVFEDLIKTFSNDRKLPKNDRQGISKVFIAQFEGLNIQTLQDLETAASSINKDGLQSKRLDHKFEQFMSTLESTTFDHFIIPYDKITESVFEHTQPEDLDEFTEDLYIRGAEYFAKKVGTTKEKTAQESPELTDEAKHDLEKMYFKILRHINLALIQKYTLMRIQMKEIDVLRREQRQLIERYEKLKSEADTQSRSMLTQFITILGIFAAILMGAFGAIQGFANIFDNAYALPLSTILIISSIGASSVLLILFFLLNGVSKLTERSLSSSSKKDGNLLEKHPSLVISHAILIFIALIGFSMKLSNLHITFSWSGLWWLLPALWAVYMFFAFSTQKLLPSFSAFLKEDEQENIVSISAEIHELIHKKKEDKSQ
ncbi:hypothetical protein NCCP2222_19060 [Sporosarcina sp. NCCP-2222]|uniref:hypothetical protein n=1 Tax=Sporosarcina sp. NCCP-2222 TaxID=2935073 RepID=UPI0020857423|nr:hypothetical protein [Sporosarcina sp. NCCP-2222]GKV55959.1 hypothetical protein NCCP2222_19060 [Sporosarcina sp. NCCP-2222]